MKPRPALALALAPVVVIVVVVVVVVVAVFAPDASTALAAPSASPLDPFDVSPAQLYRYEVGSSSVSAAHLRTSDRATFDGGHVSDDATTSTYALRLVRTSGPSLRWDLRLARVATTYSYESPPLTSVPADGTDTAILASASAAYKIMDKLVFGLGLTYARAHADGADALSVPGLRYGALVKTERYEAGLAQALTTHAQDTDDGKKRRYFHETRLHLRYEAVSLHVTRNPQPACCAGASANDLVYAAAIDLAHGDALRTQWLYSYAPARESGVTGETPPVHALAAGAYYAATDALTLALRLTYAQGAAAARDPDAYATSTLDVREADLAHRATGASLGLTLAR